MTEAWQQFLASRGAQFVDGRVNAFAASVPLPIQGAALVDLSHFGLIDVQGADAAAFLHAQLTNDVLALPDGAWQWNGWCTPKGRLLATFVVWRRGDHFFLMLPASLQAAIQKRLGLFVLRSKVAISNASEQHVLIGVVGAAVQRHIPCLDGVEAMALSPLHTLLVCDSQQAVNVWQRAQENGALEAGDAAWRWAMIESGIAWVDAATQEQFVPQMANYELTNGVSFKKGCYPGQEIVARTQYRGILKRRMLKVVTTTALTAGDAVFAAEFGNQAAGLVADAVMLGDGRTLALVVAQLESINAGSLRANDGAPLIPATLPYVVPEFAQP
jgi:hypothetical protein